MSTHLMHNLATSGVRVCRLHDLWHPLASFGSKKWKTAKANVTYLVPHRPLAGSMTALKRLSLCILWLSVFLSFSACCAAGILSPRRLYGIGGSILGLIPASLHFRTSKTQTPPRRLWRWCSVLVILAFGSLSFLAWVPGNFG